jgi:DNA-binding transcriptional ArsR family regulator
MSINSPIPDYDLPDRIVVTTPKEIRAVVHPLRVTILDLLLERAATVTELAAAVHRPKSTVAHHVNVLADAGLLRVVRTRRVRAIDERYYGRTARTFVIGTVRGPDEAVTPSHANALLVAAAESASAYETDKLTSFVRHARIPARRAAEFWDRVEELSREFAKLPRSGKTVYGFAAGIYPTDYPILPEADDTTER